MSEFIDTFYALDFDRCLGNYEANFELAKKIVDELPNVDCEEFHKAHDETRSNGYSFRILNYLKEKDPNFDESDFSNRYINYGKLNPSKLLEPGAKEFIYRLREKNHHFCIMSYGDKQWQTTKIIASGLGDIVKHIVSTEYKGQYIGEWFNNKNNHFIVPSECFHDCISRKAKKVVLVDDKFKAFESMHPNSFGYLLQSISRIYISPQGKIPKNVKRVTRLDEILEHESLI
ncbi:MAG TPA: hypothetical protein PLO25_03095 [Candidatus Saccharibacteria bacterium]|nr:hypothetical protein [Candidatus Saccharibacteria bacterium]